MIKWILDNLGTAPFEHVKADKKTHIVDVRDLVDKSGNSVDTVKEKIEKAIFHLSQNEKVVVCCDYGMSRSNAIAAGILAVWNNVTFNDALKSVIAVTNEKSIKIEVLSIVRKAVERINPVSNILLPPVGKRVLITGGSGFIGKALIPKINSLYNVFAPGRNEIDLMKGSLELDLFVKEHGISHILHLANPRIYTANSSIGESLTMLKNVIDVCENNCIRLIYLSGWEVYAGYRSRRLLASENLPLLPKGPYGEAKYLCEKLLEHHSKLYGIQYTLVRSSPVYGKGSEKFIYNFLKKALLGEDIITHKYLNGYPHLDLLYIDDLIDLLVKVIGSGVTGHFNAGSGKNISTTEVANIIIKLMGSESKVKHRKINDHVSNIIMDFDHAAKVFDWQPKIDINSGLQKIIGNK